MLAYASGMSTRTLQRVEAGEAIPTVRQLVNLALSMDRSLAELVEDEWLQFETPDDWEPGDWVPDPRGKRARLVPSTDT